MNAITILDEANAPQGPFSRQEVAAKLQRGEVTLNSLAFVEGLSQWTPLRDVLARLDATVSALSPPVAPTAATTVPNVRASTFPASRYSFAATMAPPPELEFAGFWLRVAAALIDGVVISLAVGAVMLVSVILLSVVLGVNWASLHPSPNAPLDEKMTVFVALLELILLAVLLMSGWLYHAFLESSRWQGTVGKHLLHLRVTNVEGELIGFWHATGRFFARIVSALPCYIRFLMVAFTARRQALHDMIAGTLVVKD